MFVEIFSFAKRLSSVVNKKFCPSLKFFADEHDDLNHSIVQIN
jgi:hypothetical protein